MKMALQIFQLLQGNWSFTRTLVSKLSSSPSGTVNGTVAFIPTKYENQDDSSGNGNDLYYLYKEQGEFLISTNSLKLETKREYIYKYSELHKNISVYFIPEDLKSSSNSSIGKYFHTINLIDIDKDLDSNQSEICIKGFGTHPCLDDNYELDYSFYLVKSDSKPLLSLNNFQTIVTVKGPNKDYTGTTNFTKLV